MSRVNISVFFHSPHFFLKMLHAKKRLSSMAGEVKKSLSLFFCL